MLTIRSVLFTTFFMTFTGFSLVIMAISTLFPRLVIHWVVRCWSRTLVCALKILVRLEFEVMGHENIVDGAALYAAKHQSAWDTFIYFLIFKNPSYILKKELHKIPFWGMAANKYGAISIDRSGGASSLKQLIKDTKNRLSQNYSVIIFPEGTRSAPGVKMPYHPGIAALYSATDVPVIPVAVNSGLFWGRRSFIKRPGVITIEFLPPIDRGLKRRDFMEKLESTVEAATDRLVAEAILKFPETKITLE
jgi:1-acyl-sn-glycerol-3-phosphate acyltransferase